MYGAFLLRQFENITKNKRNRLRALTKNKPRFSTASLGVTPGKGMTAKPIPPNPWIQTGEFTLACVTSLGQHLRSPLIVGDALAHLPNPLEAVPHPKKIMDLPILYRETTKCGIPITMKRLSEIDGLMDRGAKEKFKNESFFTENNSVSDWKVLDDGLVPGSAGKEPLGQFIALASYLENVVFAGVRMPKAFENALEDFHNLKGRIRKMRPEKASRVLAETELAKLAIEKPIEVAYDLAMRYSGYGMRPLSTVFIRTSTILPDGRWVVLGFNGKDGFVITLREYGVVGDSLGLRLARRYNVS